MIGLYHSFSTNDYDTLRILCENDMTMYPEKSLYLIQEIEKYLVSNVIIKKFLIISEPILRPDTKITFFNCLIHKNAFQGLNIFYADYVAFVDCEVFD